jgi:CheY-like chemotaxis protein
VDLPPPAQASLDILLVDDSIDAAVAMGLLLETLGHHVRTVHDGVTALEAARASAPQVVILDIGLPGMNGFEVARNLRRRPDMADALLVAVTGYGQASDRQLSRDAGFDLHFVKPVSFAAIEDALGSAFAPGHTRNRGVDPAP